MKLRTVLLMISFAATAFAQQEPSKGHLVLIGGGEKPPEAMRKFVELAGGPSAPIVVIPTASAEPDTGEYYIELLAEYGCTNVTPLEIRTKDDAGKMEFVTAAKNARGIFFSGGVQSRILDALDGTPVLDAIREAFENGAVIGGTSAGTACQSPLMITGDGDFSVIQAGAVELSNGLGLFDGAIVDQHFIARQRFNRLATVTLEHPDLLGVGIDEATAVWVRPDATFQVIGKGSVMVIDAREALLRRGLGDDGKALLGARDVRIHVLLDRDEFDMKVRSPSPENAPATP